MIEGISAITLATHDMRRAVRFYRMLGFAMLYNADKARDPEMHQTKKGNQWYFGMKAHRGHG